MPSITRRRPITGILYIAWNQTHDFFKIGSCQQALRNRGKELQRLLGAEIVYHIGVDHCGLLEHEIHSRLARHRIRVRPKQPPGRTHIAPENKECFRVPLDAILAEIAKVISEQNMKVFSPEDLSRMGIDVRETVGKRGRPHKQTA